MKLSLTTLFKTRDFTLPFAFQREMDDLELYGERIRITAPVQFKGTVSFADDVFIVQGKLDVAYCAHCGRCGEEVMNSLSMEVLEEYARAEDEEHPDRYLFTGDSIDLFPMVEEMIVLNMPLKHLCREDCRGVCPVCGTNRNIRDCGHKPVEENEIEQSNPFQALGALMKDMNEEE